MNCIFGAITSRDYKGYTIEGFKDGHFEVDYCGDIVIFDSEEEAEQFINEVSEEA